MACEDTTRELTSSKCFTFIKKNLVQLDKKIILKKLREVKPQLEENFNLVELALFGSYARDEQTPKSDIDIMIKMSTPSFRNLCNTAYFLEQAFPGIKIQVVSKGGIRPQYFEKIKLDLIYA